MLTPVMVNVGWSDMVKQVMFSTMVRTGHNTLQNPVIYDLAIDNALKVFNK
jgi:hypothetical protein